MRCRNCGKLIDPNSRFCSYCDCDNYPQMGQVKLKGSKPVKPNETDIQKKYTAAKPVNQTKPSTNKPQKNNNGCLTIIIIIIGIIIVLARAFSE